MYCPLNLDQSTKQDLIEIFQKNLNLKIKIKIYSIHILILKVPYVKIQDWVDMTILHGDETSQITTKSAHVEATSHVHLKLGGRTCIIQCYLLARLPNEFVPTFVVASYPMHLTVSKNLHLAPDWPTKFISYKITSSCV
jgi:hypothetical protein